MWLLQVIFSQIVRRHLTVTVISLNKCYETAKAEAYKEFAEKLKEKCYEDFQETYEMLSPYVTDDDIDNLLKEMEGE